MSLQYNESEMNLLPAESIHTPIPQPLPPYIKWRLMWLWLGLGCEVYPYSCMTCLESAAVCFWPKQINQQNGQFFAWVYLSSFWWTPLLPWLLVELWPLPELRSLLVTAIGVSGHCNTTLLSAVFLCVHQSPSTPLSSACPFLFPGKCPLCFND